MSVFAGATAPEIGLSESESLASVLRSLGMRVHIGTNFSDSGKVLRAALADSNFPIVIADQKQIGIRAWSERMSTNHHVVVITADRGSNITATNAHYVDLPARVGDVLAAAGFSVDANDPRLAAVIGADFVVTDDSAPAAAATAPAAPTATPQSPPAEERTDSPAPTSRRARRAASPTHDIDDIFADVPEAGGSSTGSHAAAPAVAPEPEVEPAAPQPAPSNEPDWMDEKIIDAPPFVPVAPEVTNTTPVPAGSHTNAAPDWMSDVVPNGEDYVPAGRTESPQPEVEEEAEEEEPVVDGPVFSAEPLDAGFDPDYEEAEEEEEPVVDLRTQEDYTPISTAPFVPKPTASAPDTPTWVDREEDREIYIPEVAPQPEPEPEVKPTTVDDFEIIAPVAVADPNVVVERAPREKSFDEMLAEVATSDSPPRPQSATIPAAAAPVSPSVPDASSWMSELPAPLSTPTADVPATFHGKSAVNLCPVIVSFASKGGVGKTSLAIGLAERAARAGFRVTLIDGNRGQGGIRKFLRVGSHVVSIYDAAVRNDPKAALSVPSEINSARAGNLPPVSFAAILAPPDQLADPRIVTAQVYAEAVEYARSISDIVILDTQISERYDTTGIIESVAIPAMMTGNGYGVGLSDGSSEGIDNLEDRLHHFTGINIEKEHLFSLVNKVSYFDDSIVNAWKSRYAPYSNFVGVVGMDEEFHNKHNVGIIDVEDSTLAPAILRILHSVTNDERFLPPPPPPQQRRSIFGRRR